MKALPRWPEKRALIFLHEESLTQFGGSSGIRDEGLLESALARPVNRHGHESCDDLAVLAADYGYGLARNHVFVDGNKRVALLAMGVFLSINGRALRPGTLDAIETMLKLASGELDLDALIAWLRRNIARSTRLRAC